MKQVYDEIKSFLNDTDIDLFESESIIFVDWREDDEAVVNYVHYFLDEDDKFEYKVEEDGDFKIILYSKDDGLSDKKSRTIVDPNSRDITIKVLNDFLKPDYEIRWFMETLGDDTLGFAVMKLDWWNKLAEEFGDRLDFYFAKIDSNSRMFELEMDEAFDLIKQRKNFNMER